jgi:glutamate synthase (NADPH/NADH) large chain
LSGDLSAEKAIYNYTKAIGKGLMKVMSKMGISTYMSYCGAQIFEAIGLNKSLVDKYFKGTASNVEGIGVLKWQKKHCACINWRLAKIRY